MTSKERNQALVNLCQVSYNLGHFEAMFGTMNPDNRDPERALMEQEFIEVLCTFLPRIKYSQVLEIIEELKT